jgi:hypothetical protein
MSSPADKQRAYRRRRGDGKIVLAVEVDEIAAAEALVTHGLLRRCDADDRRALGDAASRLIDLLAKVPVTTGNATPSAPMLCGRDDRKSGD